MFSLGLVKFLFGISIFLQVQQITIQLTIPGLKKSQIPNSVKGFLRQGLITIGMCENIYAFFLEVVGNLKDLFAVSIVIINDLLSIKHEGSDQRTI